MPARTARARSIGRGTTSPPRQPGGQAAASGAKGTGGSVTFHRREQKGRRPRPKGRGRRGGKGGGRGIRRSADCRSSGPSGGGWVRGRGGRRSGRQSAWLVHRIGRGARTGGHRDDSPADNRDTPPGLLGGAGRRPRPDRARRGVVAADAIGGACCGTRFAMTSPAPGGLPLPPPPANPALPRTAPHCPGPLRRGRSLAGYQDDPIRGRIVRHLPGESSPYDGGRDSGSRGTASPIGQTGLRSGATGRRWRQDRTEQGAWPRTICFGVFGREPSRSRGRSPAATVGGASRWRRSEMQTAPAEARSRRAGGGEGRGMRRAGLIRC